MARLRPQRSSTHRIAVVDDDAALRDSTIRLLQAEGHEVFSAEQVEQGVALVRERSPHLVLLDYYMPGGTGAELVRRVRRFDSLVQVVLVTGYAADQPGRRLLAELDIQGYHDKGDGPERLMVQVDAALKHYRALHRIDRQREHLKSILDASPEISRLQPLSGVFDAALKHVGALLDGKDGFIATPNSGLFVMDDATTRFSIRAATGRFAGVESLAAMPTGAREMLEFGIRQDEPTERDNYVVIPLVTREGHRGCMAVEGGALPEDGKETCQLYARQVVQALENVILHERATIDPLTGVLRRSAGVVRLEQILRLGQRTGQPTSVLMLDVDHFKNINDRHGHAAGDLALRITSRTVVEACRMSDVVVRYGGEELAVVLPATAVEGALVVAERIRHAVERTVIDFEDQKLSVTISIGAATRQQGEIDPGALLRRADQALYQAKRAGRNRVVAWRAEGGGTAVAEGSG